MRKLYSIIIFVFIFFAVNAQRQNTNFSGRIYGKLLDAKTKEAIPFASVTIFKNDSLITGSLSGNNGEFNIEKLPFGRFNLKITSVGFKTYQQIISVTPQTEEQDIGNIKMEMDETLLKAVEITEEKSAVEMSIDRKVFNVDKNITSKGGTATDVMKNIPSVTVDENGSAQLRQNGATLYIDGRPTTLSLDQIPADQIEKVEVITNPSSKYEANASGGIINIVMKSNTKLGYYGTIGGGIGTNDHYNGMGSLNVKQKAVGFFLAYNYNTFQNPIAAYNYRTNLNNGTIIGYYDSDNNKVFRNIFNNGSAGIDYSINNRNTLSVSENITIGNFDTKENQIFKTRITEDSITSSGTRLTNSVIHFENYTTKLRYKKTFPKKEKEFTSDINYNTTNAYSRNNFNTNTYNASGTLFPNNPELQTNNGRNRSETYTVQADFINPINDSTKLELGIRSNYKASNILYEVSNYSYYYNSDTIDPYFTNHYTVKDLVNAAYINYSFKYKKINYMLGLRFEHSYYKGTLLNKSDSSFQYSYPTDMNNIMNAMFPAIFISKKFNLKQTVQFNISRKINRPDFRQLSPTISSSDRRNYSVGNPLLIPEFITIAELNLNQYLSKGNFFISLFYRNTQNPMTNFNYKYPSDSTILVSTTINGKQSNSVGMDNTFKYTLIKGFEATLNMNLFYTVIDASYNNNTFNNQGFYYTSKLNLNYRLPKNLSIQLSGSYESPKVIPQGKTKEQYYVDCGISKEIYKFITLTLSVNDVFDTKGRGNYLTTDQYIQDYWSRRETRYIKFTAIMSFGKADASLFKKRQQMQQGDMEGGY